jgi:hypothetical protein
MNNNFRSTQPFNPEFIVGTELYDYEKDPNETNNVVNEKEYKAVAVDLKAKMLAYFAAQVK